MDTMTHYELDHCPKVMLVPGESVSPSTPGFEEMLDDWRTLEAHPDIHVDVEEYHVRWYTEKEEVAKQHGFTRTVCSMEDGMVDELLSMERWNADTELWVSIIVEPAQAPAVEHPPV